MFNALCDHYSRDLVASAISAQSKLDKFVQLSGQPLQQTYNNFCKITRILDSAAKLDKAKMATHGVNQPLQFAMMTPFQMSTRFLSAIRQGPYANVYKVTLDGFIGLNELPPCYNILKRLQHFLAQNPQEGHKKLD